MSTVEKGFIFILTNPAQPDLVLIGAGADHPERALRAGLLDDSVTGQTPLLRYTALVENVPASTQYIDDALTPSSFGIGYFEVSVDEAIATIKDGSGEILYEEVISTEPSEQMSEVDEPDEPIDPSQQMVAVDDEEEDLWQRQTVRVNPRPRSWGPMPRNQRRSPSRTYRSNIKDRQMRKQNALRKLAASVGGEDIPDTDVPDVVVDNTPIQAVEKKQATKAKPKQKRKAEKKQRKAKKKHDHETPIGKSLEADVDLTSKDEATLGNEPSNLWQSREHAPEPVQNPNEHDPEPVLTPSHRQRDSDAGPRPVATPMARDSERIELPEETDDILEDISMNWLWQRNNDVNVRRESGEATDPEGERSGLEDSQSVVDVDYATPPANPSQPVSNPPPHPSAQVTKVNRRARAETQAEIHSKTHSPAPANPGGMADAGQVDISSGSDAAAAIDFLAEVPLTSEGDRIDPRIDPQRPVKQVPLPDARLRNNAPSVPSNEAEPGTETPRSKINVSPDGDVPVVKIPGNKKTEPVSKQLEIDPVMQPVPIEPKQAKTAKKPKAKRKARAAPMAPPAPPRSQHEAPVGQQATAPQVSAETNDVFHQAGVGPQSAPGPATTTNPVIDTPSPDPVRPDPTANTATGQAVDPKTAEKPMDASQIASWVESQEETHVRKTTGRRALRLSLLGVPLGALAGAAYLVVEPGLPQSTKIAIIIGAMFAGVAVCYLLARLFSRNPQS